MRNDATDDDDANLSSPLAVAANLVRRAPTFVALVVDAISDVENERSDDVKLKDRTIIRCEKFCRLVSFLEMSLTLLVVSLFACSGAALRVELSVLSTYLGGTVVLFFRLLSLRANRL